MKTIQLTQGKVALVDDEDFKTVTQFKWCARKGVNTFYAVRKTKTIAGKRTTQAMHQLILPTELEVDHKDRNGLNNQRHNLRPATRLQNQRNVGLRKDNKSGCRGVRWRPNKDGWLP